MVRKQPAHFLRSLFQPSGLNESLHVRRRSREEQKKGRARKHI
jgi:hypothetical protein